MGKGPSSQPAEPQPQQQEAPAQPLQPEQQQPSPTQRRPVLPHVAARHMSWAQYILPSLEQNISQQMRRSDTSTTTRPARRWAPVALPIRYAGTARVY